MCESVRMLLVTSVLAVCCNILLEALFAVALLHSVDWTVSINDVVARLSLVINKKIHGGIYIP